MDSPGFDTSCPPRHIAIIMDGNGRWAKQRGQSRTSGHKAGVETIRDIVKACSAWGVEYLTLYAFSSENWKRPEKEVSFLMNLLGTYLGNEIKKLHKQNVRFKTIGCTSEFAPKLRQKMDEGEQLTRNNTGLTLVLALNYGSRTEIIDAIRKIKATDIAPEEITEEFFSSQLYTSGIPDPELMIRTSGEQRISNFLLWQISYSELIFTPVLWPDFNRQHLAQAIAEYQSRHRRFGGL